MKAARTWAWKDDAWIEGAQLPVTDRAVRYGMAVFETIGVHDGSPLYADEHIALLSETARKLLGIARRPIALPLLDCTQRGMLRIYITAGDGSPTDDVTMPCIFAMFESTQAAALSFQTACIHPEPVIPFAHGCKTANYWMNCAAQAEAEKSGYDHALLHDPDGNILSAAFGNLFFVIDGTLCTPALSLAVRPGVVRDWVIRRTGAKETILPVTRLGEVSEVFMSNSRLGVMPLRVGGVGPGPVGRTLREDIIREKLVP